jgi:hypothetical protein
MTPEREPLQTQSPRVHRASSAAVVQKVHAIGARIFAELLPHHTRRRPREERASLARTSDRTTASSAMRGKKKFLSMQAYRTETMYYFSSKQLLPAGSLVFYSTKLSRYIHPTAGTLLDAHPRLKILPVLESRALETQWHEALAKY